MFLEHHRENIKTAACLVFGYCVSRTVHQGIKQNLEVEEGSFDERVVSVGSLGLGWYASSKVQDYIDKSIDKTFLVVDKVHEMWTTSDPEQADEGDGAEADAETTTSEEPIDEK